MNELKDLLNELRSELKTDIYLDLELSSKTNFQNEKWNISVKKEISIDGEWDFYNYTSLEATIEGVKNLLEINKILQK